MSLSFIVKKVALCLKTLPLLIKLFPHPVSSSFLFLFRGKWALIFNLWQCGGMILSSANVCCSEMFHLCLPVQVGYNFCIKCPALSYSIQILMSLSSLHYHNIFHQEIQWGKQELLFISASLPLCRKKFALIYSLLKASIRGKKQTKPQR